GTTHGSDDQASALRHALKETREPTAEHRVQMREELALLSEALDSLDTDFRAVLVLRDVNGQDYQQIAEVLDVPVGTVKSRLFRARLALRQAMYQLTGEKDSTGPSGERT